MSQLRPSKLVEGVKDAQKEVGALVFSFIHTYDRVRSRDSHSLDIDPQELQADLKKLRLTMASLLRSVGTLEAAIEDQL